MAQEPAKLQAAEPAEVASKVMPEAADSTPAEAGKESAAAEKGKEEKSTEEKEDKKKKQRRLNEELFCAFKYFDKHGALLLLTVAPRLVVCVAVDICRWAI